MPFQNDGVMWVYEHIFKTIKKLTRQLFIQIINFSFGIQRDGRCMIADDMGLGKTFQALAIADYYKEDWPLLIVTTSTMR